MFQKDVGPIYRISRRSQVKEQPVSITVVKSRDRRPGWERRYHAPLNDPQQRQPAIELLTIDNFSPNPMTLLKRHISAGLAKLESSPESTEIIIKRFHVAVRYAGSSQDEKSFKLYTPFTTTTATRPGEDAIVNQVHRDDAYVKAREEWQKADQVAHAEGKESPPKPDYQSYSSGSSDRPFDTVGDEIATGVFAAVLNVSISAIAALPGLVSSGYDTLKAQANLGPPPEWATVDPGVTCQIEGQVTLCWPDGRKTTIPMKMKQTERYAISPVEDNYEVASFLVSVIEQTAKSVTQEAAQFLDSSLDPVQSVKVDEVR